ncbi:MAG: aldose 1-epimerase family protein [Clostridia bacterium]|nr:aldose 1-epimerase family protein [Clostridia bacterium]
MILENERWAVTITETGAELTAIYDKKQQTDLLWEGAAPFWRRHAPVLFPHVGRTWGDVLRLNGRVYPCMQHGFARSQVFTAVQEGKETGIFTLCANEETREKYPFDFVLCITYTLGEKELQVRWQVENRGHDPMPFTIGGHPAFRFAEKEGKKEDYCLYFPGKEELSYCRLDTRHGTAIPEKVYRLKTDGGYVPLSDGMFKEDALIFDGGQIEEAWLCRKNGTPRVGLRSRDFPNYGIWSMVGAPFVCLEPWQGRCDDCGENRDFSEKPDAVVLAAGESFQKEYQILVP